MLSSLVFRLYRQESPRSRPCLDWWTCFGEGSGTRKTEVTCTCGPPRSKMYKKSVFLMTVFKVPLAILSNAFYILLGDYRQCDIRRRRKNTHDFKFDPIPYALNARHYIPTGMDISDDVQQEEDLPRGHIISGLLCLQSTVFVPYHSTVRSNMHPHSLLAFVRRHVHHAVHRNKKKLPSRLQH